MATQLDLQEQEQLDALKAFWNKYGNLVTWTLVLALGAYAAWNGWQYWQRDHGLKAGAMFEELERAAQAGDADKAGRIFADLRDRYAGTAFAQQGALLAARVQVDKGQPDAAKASLAWVADKGDAELRPVAALRLAALQAEAKQYDEALKTLAAARVEGFEALADDRRGDVLMAQGKKAEALVAYQAAFKAMTGTRVDYRNLIEAKLTALGAAPAPPSAAASGTAP